MRNRGYETWLAYLRETNRHCSTIHIKSSKWLLFLKTWGILTQNIIFIQWILSKYKRVIVWDTVKNWVAMEISNTQLRSIEYYYNNRKPTYLNSKISKCNDLLLAKLPKHLGMRKLIKSRYRSHTFHIRALVWEAGIASRSIQIVSIFPPNCCLCYAKRANALCGRTIGHLCPAPVRLCHGAFIVASRLYATFLQCVLRVSWYDWLEYIISRVSDLCSHSWRSLIACDVWLIVCSVLYLSHRLLTYMPVAYSTWLLIRPYFIHYTTFVLKFSLLALINVRSFFFVYLHELVFNLSESFLKI